MEELCSDSELSRNKIIQILEFIMMVSSLLLTFWHFTNKRIFTTACDVIPTTLCSVHINTVLLAIIIIRLISPPRNYHNR